MRLFYFQNREVYDFLISIKLFRYIEIFIIDGIEHLETILEINENYFKEREYSKAYKKRILEKIGILGKEHSVSGVESSTDVNFDNLPPLGMRNNVVDY